MLEIFSKRDGNKETDFTSWKQHRNATTKCEICACVENKREKSTGLA